MLKNLSGAIDHTVSISQFHDGMAEQVFSNVRKSGTLVVIKNNEPECVLMSPSEYINFMEELADAKLKLLTLQRIVNGSLDQTSTQKEVMESFGITEEDLDAMGEVEIE